MSTVWAVTRREIQAYFVSPIAYAFATVFLVLSAMAFLRGIETYVRIPEVMLEQTGGTIRTLLVAGRFGLIPWTHVAMLLSLPGLSMRLLTEERKSGTAELLFTSPVTTWQIILGKYLGTLGVYGLILALTTPMVGFLAWKAQPEWAALAVAYLGLFLHGAFLLAIGLFASSLTENQFVALLVTYVIVVPFYVIEFIVGFLGGKLDVILASISVTWGLRRAGAGALDSHYLVLWFLMIFVFLFLSERVLESGRWR